MDDREEAQEAARCNGRLPWSCHAIDGDGGERTMLRFHADAGDAEDAWHKVCDEYRWTYGGVYCPTVSQLVAAGLVKDHGRVRA